MGWFVAGIPLWWLYSWMFASSDTAPAVVAALVTWGTFWSATSLRLTSLRCFRCGGRAFDDPHFSIADAKCQSCGVTHKVSRNPLSLR